jgi:hypothetical protein
MVNRMEQMKEAVNHARVTGGIPRYHSSIVGMVEGKAKGKEREEERLSGRVRGTQSNETATHCQLYASGKQLKAPLA